MMRTTSMDGGSKLVVVVVVSKRAVQQMWQGDKRWRGTVVLSVCVDLIENV